MGFWQTQLNLVVWWATTGCVVSAKDHLRHPSGLSRSLYQFHTYYEIRRILAELSPLPDESTWKAYEIAYNQDAYMRIYRDFNVSPSTDWRRMGFPNFGLKKIYLYERPSHLVWLVPPRTATCGTIQIINSDGEWQAPAPHKTQVHCLAG